MRYSFSETTPKTYDSSDRISEWLAANYAVGDVFCGVGGLTHGFVLENFDVVVGIDSDEKLTKLYKRFCRIEGFTGMLIEPMVTGVELIVGSKIDYQFGPVILMGIGGTGVEIYRDVVLRMAPLVDKDVGCMITGLRAHELLEGYRGSDPVDMGKLGRLLMDFSALVMDLQDMVESIDLNPVMCSSTACVVADARILLKNDA